MRYLILVCLLIWNVSAFSLSESKIEKNLEKAPKVTSSADLEKLMKKITVNLKSDEDKAYASLVWIVRNIDYDWYKYEQIEKIQEKKGRRSRAHVPEGGDILKTRLGVCADIAQLYIDMLKKVGVKAVYVRGCAGQLTKNKTECEGGSWHAWNAVWIDKQWELVDPTWAITGGNKYAMKGISRKHTYERELRKREKRRSDNYESRAGRTVDRKWFMPDPEEMKDDHQPLEDRWFLLKSRDRKNQRI